MSLVGLKRALSLAMPVVGSGRLLDSPGIGVDVSHLEFMSCSIKTVPGPAGSSCRSSLITGALLALLDTVPVAFLFFLEGNIL